MTLYKVKVKLSVHNWASHQKTHGRVEV